MDSLDSRPVSGEHEQQVPVRGTTQAIAGKSTAPKRKVKAGASTGRSISKAPLRTSNKGSLQGSHLQLLLATREELRERATGDITCSIPMLTQDGEGIVWPYTINLIQGQTGTHKSRVAELFASLLIAQDGFQGETIGLVRTKDAPCSVCYVDTERNQQEQLPQAIQKIKEKAGYERSEHPNHFEYISLLAIPRTERLEALREYLNYMREQVPGHLVIILDQLADCVADFNDPKESMLLTDLLNVMVNQQDVTFLCIIHENPGGSKARGHLGTEGANKASTVLQVSYIKAASGAPGNVLQMKYIKRRSGSPNLAFHVQYDAEKGELVRAGDGAVADALNNRKKTALPADVIAKLGAILTSERMPITKLKDKLVAELGGSTKTMGQRLADIISQQTPVPDTDGVSCTLKQKKVSKEVRCWLEPHSSTITQL
jgi:hypothetical protein